LGLAATVLDDFLNQVASEAVCDSAKQEGLLNGVSGTVPSFLITLHSKAVLAQNV
jgi:hypothetical protein